MATQRTDAWYRERAFRLTASQFHSYIHKTPHQLKQAFWTKTDDDLQHRIKRNYAKKKQREATRKGTHTLSSDSEEEAILIQALKQHQQRQSDSEPDFVKGIKEWGILREHLALKTVSRALDYEISEAYLVVCKEYPFLAATPDGFLRNQDTGQIEACIEVKCPWSQRMTGERPKYVSIDPKTKNYRLLSSHAYYYQVQGQMLCCEVDYTIFAAWTPYKTYIMRVERDSTFIHWMVKELIAYYKQCFYPAIGKAGLGHRASIHPDDIATPYKGVQYDHLLRSATNIRT